MGWESTTPYRRMRFLWSRECMAFTSRMKSSSASGWLSTSVLRHFTATFSYGQSRDELQSVFPCAWSPCLAPHPPEQPLTVLPAGVHHSPRRTTPKEPSPSFSKIERSRSRTRQVRECWPPASGGGGVGGLRKVLWGWGGSSDSGRFPLNTCGTRRKVKCGHGNTPPVSEKCWQKPLPQLYTLEPSDDS